MQLAIYNYKFKLMTVKLYQSNKNNNFMNYTATKISLKQPS